MNLSASARIRCAPLVGLCAGVIAALSTSMVEPLAWAQELTLPQTPPIVPETLEPRTDRNEFDSDRIIATALFGEGRIHFRHDELEAALAKYERAYRYSGRSTTILDETVPLAFRLGRVDQATRYAVLANEDHRIDPFILRRLAILLTEREDYAEALRLYKLSDSQNVEQNDGDASAGPSVITDFEVARLSFLIENYDQAANRFERVLKVIDGGNAKGEDKVAVETLMKEPSSTLALIAEAYLGAKRLDAAEKLFRRALTTPQQAPMLRYHLARLAAERNRSASVLEELEPYFESGSDEAGTAPYELLERVFQEQQRSGEFVKRLSELWKQQPDNLFLGYYLADTLLESGAPASAIPLFEKLIADRPLLDAYRGLLTAYHLEKQHQKFCLLLADATGKLDGIEQLQETLRPIATDDEFVSELFNLAEDRTFFGKDDSAKSRSLSRGLAHLAILREDYDAADRYFEAAVGSKKPDTHVWLNWAIEQMIADRLDQAMANLKSLSKQTLPASEAAMVQYYLAGALALNEDTDLALEAAEEAARLLPDVPSVEVRVPWVLSLGKRWPDARRAYLDFLERYGSEFGSSSLRQVVREAKSSLSTIELELGDEQAAEEWLEQILDEFPADVGTMNDLGYLWADRGINLQKALAMIQRATKAEPDNYAYRDSLGWVLFRLGRLDEAVAELRRAAETDDPDGVVLDHLGDAVAARSGADAARPHWERAIELLRESNPEQTATIQRKLEGVGDQP